jgi:uncharacterized protein (UPF0335 family)
MAEVRATNEITQEQSEPFIRRIESYLRDLESERGAYMNRCRGIKDEMKTVYEDASGAGVPRASLKAAIDTAQLQRKINKVAAQLEADAHKAFEDLMRVVEGLDDLPLGQAAIERDMGPAKPRRAKPKQESPALDRLTGAECRGQA